MLAQSAVTHSTEARHQSSTKTPQRNKRQKKKINSHRLARIFLAAFAWISLPVLHFVPPAASQTHTQKKKRRYASPVVGLIIINRRSNALSHKLSPAKRRSRICEHCFFLRIAIRLLLPAPVGPHTRTARAHDVLLHLQTFRKPLPPSARQCASRRPCLPSANVISIHRCLRSDCSPATLSAGSSPLQCRRARPPLSPPAPTMAAHQRRVCTLFCFCNKLG